MLDMEKKKRNSVTKSKEVLASQTILAVVSSDTISEAAEKLGISRQMVHERIKRWDLKEQLAEVKDYALNELQIGASKAARNLVSKIHDEDSNISMKASTEILDRIGLTKQDAGSAKVNVNFNQIINEHKNKYNI